MARTEICNFNVLLFYISRQNVAVVSFPEKYALEEVSFAFTFQYTYSVVCLIQITRCITKNPIACLICLSSSQANPVY